MYPRGVLPVQERRAIYFAPADTSIINAAIRFLEALRPTTSQDCAAIRDPGCNSPRVEFSVLFVERHGKTLTWGHFATKF